jgi:uncharacterized repeat protein (TIGR03833 family)
MRMRVLPSLLLIPSVSTLLIVSRSTRVVLPGRGPRAAMVAHPHHRIQNQPSTRPFFTFLPTLDASSSPEEQQQHDETSPNKKAHKKKKGFVINPDLPSVISSGIDTAPTETVERRSTGRLGVSSGEDHTKIRPRRGRQQQRGRNNNSRTSAVPAPPDPGQPGRGCYRRFIHSGAQVLVVLKGDQRTGIETRGNVERHLTNSPYHPRGIKVMLTSGQVGRVTKIIDDVDVE